MISAIASVDNDWGIGKENKLLLSPSEDMDFFQFMTMGSICIMGRNTWDSLKAPLKSRHNMVLTHNAPVDLIFCPENTNVSFLDENEIDLFLKYHKYNREIFIIGGEQIYKKYIEYCERIYLTKIYKSFGADKFFPNLDNDDNWKIIAKSKEKYWTNSIKFQFFKYERRDMGI